MYVQLWKVVLIYLILYIKYNLTEKYKYIIVYFIKNDNTAPTISTINHVSSCYVYQFLPNRKRISISNEIAFYTYFS